MSARSRSTARSRTRAALLAFGLLVLPSAAAAQVTAGQLAGMNFGQVAAGRAKQIQPTDPAAGRFRVTAPAGRRITLTFVLPTALQFGLSVLPISFGATDAAWSSMSSTAGATRFDPRLPLTVTVPSNGRVNLWLGASISPLPAQATGRHTGTVTLSVLQLP